MKNYSIWNDIKRNKYNELDKDIMVDVLIIGGGITGISTAYHLINSNLKVCLVEKNHIGSGVTSKTTGKITYLQDLIYSKLNDNYSFSVAKLYYESQIEAIRLVESIIKSNKIDCDYTKQKSYLFASEKIDVEKIKKEKYLLEKMGVKVEEGQKLPINMHNYYNISVDDTAYFHPLKYLNELSKICNDSGISIYENTNICKFVLENDKYVCYTKKNKIIAKQIVIACHYPFFIVPFLFPLKGHLERSYISASKVEEKNDVSGINTSKSTKSFRYHKDYLIYLNGSHNLAFKYNVVENINNLIMDLKTLKIDPSYIWSNEDIITNDYLPYIGKIKDNMFTGVGYNTWGMTNGSLAGKIISDLILNKDNKYQGLFNPKRVMTLKSKLNIFYDIFSSAKPLIENKIIRNKPFYSKNVIFTYKEGEMVGIYTDKDNKEHIVYNKCPHFKCSLIFNEKELTWDCPCHSSRFDIDGVCIKGPSNYNISYKEKK